MSLANRTAVVIGYGNRLRHDDGLGPHVADQLAARGWSGVRILAAHQLTPEMAAEFTGASVAVFVDAALPADAPEVCVEAIGPAEATWSMTHVYQPEFVLGLARAVYGHAPPAWMVRVRGECFEPGEGLTPTAQRRADSAIQHIGAILAAENRIPPRHDPIVEETP